MIDCFWVHHKERYVVSSMRPQAGVLWRKEERKRKRDLRERVQEKGEKQQEQLIIGSTSTANIAIPEWSGYETRVVWAWDQGGLGMRPEWSGYETMHCLYVITQCSYHGLHYAEVFLTLLICKISLVQTYYTSLSYCKVFVLVLVLSILLPFI